MLEFERLVKLANAYNSIADVKEEGKLKRPKKMHRLVKKALALDSIHREMLAEFLEGEAMLVNVEGEQYFIKKYMDGWMLRALTSGAAVHTVTPAGCSCEDSRFRNRDCKHQRAVVRSLKL